MRREAWFPFVILLGLFILTGNHVGRSLGDAIFDTLGISPWSRGDRTGFHYPVLLGLLLLIVGFVGTVRHYQLRFPRIRSRIIIGCLLFIFLYPQVAESATFLLLRNADGFRSIHYVKEDSHCSFESEGDKVTATCSFTIYNYGNVDELTITPILSYINGIRWEARTLSIRPHERSSLGALFEGTLSEVTGIRGSDRQVGAEIKINGITKRFE